MSTFDKFSQNIKFSKNTLIVLTKRKIFENHVNHVNPTNKIELMNTVNEAAHELFTDQDLVKRIILNIKKRAKLCVEQNGGHFEHLLKLKNYKNEE